MNTDPLKARLKKSLKRRISRCDIETSADTLHIKINFMLFLAGFFSKTAMQISSPREYKAFNRCVIPLNFKSHLNHLLTESTPASIKITVTLPKILFSGRKISFTPTTVNPVHDAGAHLYSVTLKKGWLLPKQQLPKLKQVTIEEKDESHQILAKLELDSSNPLFSYDLIAISRFDKQTVETHARYIENKILFRLPVGHCFYENEARWDFIIQIRYLQEVVYRRTLNGDDLALQNKKHIYKSDIGNGTSASFFLTERIQSLAAYVAPHDKHNRMVAIEDAKLSYPQFIENLPLDEDLVFFESFLGKTYSGNPRYIYEELLRASTNLRFVWSYEGSFQIPGNPIIVNRKSPDYYRYLATAKYRVNNVIFPVHGRKDETIYLQTWHGTPLKKLSFDIEVQGPEVAARDNFYKESRAWTHLISPNSFSTEVFRRAFRYSGDILELGYPLADELQNPSCNREIIIEKLALPSSKRFILYAPTWRDNKAVGAWQHEFDLQLDLNELSSALPEDTILLIKAHHLVSEKLDNSSLPFNVLDMSQTDDINELCIISDILITDYSSVFFDFAVSGRPILFYCYDLEVYATEIRGFYLDVERDLPGPISRNTKELTKHIQSIENITRQYSDKYSLFQERFCKWSDGRSSRKVVEAIFGKHYEH